MIEYNQMENAREDKNLNVTSSSNWRFFNVGFWILILSSSSLVLIKTRWQINSIYVAAPLLCIGMIFLLIASIQDFHSRIRQLSLIYRLIFGYLIVWGLMTAFRGFFCLPFSRFDKTDG